jgi:hypothetical protein
LYFCNLSFVQNPSLVSCWSPRACIIKPFCHAIICVTCNGFCRTISGGYRRFTMLVKYLETLFSLVVSVLTASIWSSIACPRLTFSFLHRNGVPMLYLSPNRALAVCYYG